MAGPAATIGSNHVCPMCSGTVPHVGGPITQGEPTVLISGKPAATMGSLCVCAGGPDTIATGVSNVLICGKPAATTGSMTAHGGSVITGSPTVLIGTGSTAKTVVMPIDKIPIINISLIDRIKSVLIGQGANLREAEANQQQLQELEEHQEEEPQPKLMLTKVAFKTRYDVCSDDVGNFNDYSKFYVLKDGAEYYHWLHERKEDKKKSIIKPERIPITFASDNKIVLKATFKVTSDINFPEKPQIRVTDKKNKYSFDVDTKKAKTSGEFEISFKSNNMPYEDTIQFIDYFELAFEYSEDGSTWKKAGSSLNTLYLTWKTPLSSLFLSKPKEENSLRIRAKFNKKRNIQETLLSIGCKQATGLGKASKKVKENEEQILDAIFKEFESLAITRTREGNTDLLDKNLTNKGLGYWRGKSDMLDATFKDDKRGLRVLLRDGEARCGEFASFFIYIALSQGIELSGRFNIYSAHGAKLIPEVIPPKYINSTFLVKTWKINDPKAPTENPSTKNKAQGNKNPRHFFSDHVFAVFNKGGEKKYYDPSYGVKSNKFFVTDKELLNSYASDNLSGVVFAKKEPSGTYFKVNHLGSPLYIPLHDNDTKALYLYNTKTVDMEKYLATKMANVNNTLILLTNNDIITAL